MEKINDFLATLPDFLRANASEVLSRGRLMMIGGEIKKRTNAEKIAKAIEDGAIFHRNSDGDYVFSVQGWTDAVITKTEYDFAVFCGGYTDDRHIGLNERRHKYEDFRKKHPALTLRQVRHLIDDDAESTEYWAKACKLIKEFEENYETIQQ